MQYTAIFYCCKDVNFQLIFCLFLFLLQTELVGTSENCLSEGVLTSTYNLCFTAKQQQKTPSFSILKWGARGLRLHGCVIIMQLSQNRVGESVI